MVFYEKAFIFNLLRVFTLVPELIPTGLHQRREHRDRVPAQLLPRALLPSLPAKEERHHAGQPAGAQAEPEVQVEERRQHLSYLGRAGE